MNKGTPADPLPAWEDPRVQIVYTLLCADEAPPDREEHWEGWIARRIVAALATAEPAASGRVELTPAQRDGLTCKRAVSIPGVHPTESARVNEMALGEVTRQLLAALDALAETQRSSNATRSDEPVAVQIDNAWKEGFLKGQATGSLIRELDAALAEAKAAAQRGAVQPPSDDRPIDECARCGKTMSFDELEPTEVCNNCAQEFYAAAMAVQPPARLDPNESDPYVLWAEIARLQAATKGPEGFASWQDAATAERIRRVKAERGAVQPPAPEPVAWAVEKWNSEVKNRPLGNIHRRTLDDVWRQVIRYFGGDDRALVGPTHDEMIVASPPIAQRGAALTDERAAFEKWAAEHLYASMEEKDEESVYRFSVTQDCWNAWQARAALSPEDAGKPEVR